MLNKIILILTIFTGISLSTFAANNLKAHESSVTPNAIDFRVFIPQKSYLAIALANKDAGSVISYVSFGKSIHESMTTFWVEVTIDMEGGSTKASTELFHFVNSKLLKSIQIASNDGILYFNLEEYIIERSAYNITSDQGTFGSITERARIPLTETEFNAIRDHTHLGVQVEAYTGILGPMIVEKKAWTSFQKKLTELYDIQYK